MEFLIWNFYIFKLKTLCKPPFPTAFQVMIDMNALSPPKRRRKNRPVLTSPATIKTTQTPPEFTSTKMTRLGKLAARRESTNKKRAPRKFKDVLSIFSDGSKKAPLEGRVSHIYKRRLRKKNKMLAASTPRTPISFDFSRMKNPEIITKPTTTTTTTTTTATTTTKNIHLATGVYKKVPF